MEKVKWNNPPKVWSKETIENEAEKLKKDVTQILDKICPMKKHKIKTKPPSWWSTELHNLKIKVRNTQNEWRRISSNPDSDQDRVLEKYNAYKSIRADFSKLALPLCKTQN